MGNKKKNLSIAILSVLIVTSLFLVGEKTKIQPIQALSDREELEKLERKSTEYQQIINQKQQQQTTLENQLKLMDVQVDRFGNEVDIVKQDIERYKSEIEQTQQQLEAATKEYEEVRARLEESIRLYDQIDQEFALEYLTSDGDLSLVLNQSEYLDQTAQRVAQVLNETEAQKQKLEEKKNDYDNKRADLEKREAELGEQIFYLNNEKMTKNVLLDQTEGEEAKYKKLLSRVEKQKKELLGDIDSLSSEKRGELDKILAKAPKPKSGLASTSWYYAQDDKKWAYKRIGLSSSLMKDYGCAVTALAMVFTHYGEKISPGKLASQPIFYRDLIVWPSTWKGVDLNSSINHGNIDWSRVKKEVKKDRPVIVFVRSRTGAGHYVVVHGRDKKGKYVVHDPLFGANIYLDTTEKLVGAIFDTSTTVDQMIIYND